MDPELLKIREQIIAVVQENEDALMAVQDRIDAIIEDAKQDFTLKSKALEEKYAALPDATSESFMSEYHQIEHGIQAQTQRSLDSLLHELES